MLDAVNAINEMIGDAKDDGEGDGIDHAEATTSTHGNVEEKKRDGNGEEK